MHEDYLALYRQAFVEFGAMALWDVKPAMDPSRQDALAVVGHLRRAGNKNASILAERLERACGTLAC